MKELKLKKDMIMLNKVIIFGLNDFAELAHYYLTTDSNYEIIAFTVNKEYLTTDTFKELPVVAFEEIEQHYPPTEYLLFTPMVGVKMNTVRKKIYLEGKQKGYTFATYVSSKATVCHNKIGENCFILEDNTLQPFTKIGNNVIMWSGNHIGHHGIVEDHAFFTSHVVLSGHCHVKERVWIGVNATIRDGITIGEGSLIAMGSMITKSTDNNGFYIGSPAKKQEKSSIEIY
jgi:sugar O-acyltransferase (sialic acid O-acetyltransferase NeuD family)